MHLEKVVGIGLMKKSELPTNPLSKYTKGEGRSAIESLVLANFQSLFFLVFCVYVPRLIMCSSRPAKLYLVVEGYTQTYL